jgi:cell division GTPase FtsZ
MLALQAEGSPRKISFRGRKRARRADIGIDALNDHVATLITILNQKLVTPADEHDRPADHDGGM